MIPHDHAQILNDHGVIRRISVHHLVEDEKTLGMRVSSMAFQPSTSGNGGMSVDLESSIIDAGLDPAEFVVNPPFVGAVSFLAGDLRVEQMMVGYDPLPENEHHGEVWGDFSRQKKKKLQAIAKMYVAPKA